MTNQELDLLEPILMVDDIQGNILGGFNKDHQGIIPLRFAGDDATVGAVRQWLACFAQRVTPLSEVMPFKREFKRRKEREGAEPADMISLWRNIAFSYPGLRKLTPQAEAFTDSTFRNGLPAASQRLGDPLTPGTPGEKHGWVIGKPDEIPDILLIIAGDDPDLVEHEVNTVIAEARASGMVCSFYDIGHDLSYYNRGTLHYDHGHEHFGFEDGISQPGVRGYLSAQTNDFLTPRVVISSSNPDLPEWGAPGQPLVCVGEFVLGYGKQNPAFPRLAVNPDKLGPQPYAPDPTAVAPYWARNGSYLVYRRLKQDVPAFNQFIATKAHELAQKPEFPGMTPEKLGALLVGRWKSGAPVMRSPQSENSRLGTTSPANNAFGYGGIVDDPHDGFPFTLADPNGTICPIAAHIRKVNPRDLNTDQGSSPATLKHRILRRGIPFGRPLPLNAMEDTNSEERGLLFLSYQASIANQFEFLYQRWMNQPDKPSLIGTMGFDMVVGQNNQGTPPRVRSCVLRSALGPDVTVSTQNVAMKDWIIPTGGGYFFAPSLSALRDVLCSS